MAMGACLAAVMQHAEPSLCCQILARIQRLGIQIDSDNMEAPAANTCHPLLKTVIRSLAGVIRQMSSEAVHAAHASLMPLLACALDNELPDVRLAAIQALAALQSCSAVGVGNGQNPSLGLTSAQQKLVMLYVQRETAVRGHMHATSIQVPDRLNFELPEIKYKVSQGQQLQ